MGIVFKLLVINWHTKEHLYFFRQTEFMCLTVPAKIISISGQSAVVRTARKNIERQVLLSLVENAQVGDWLQVNGEMAVEKIDESQARELVKLLTASRENT